MTDTNITDFLKLTTFELGDFCLVYTLNRDIHKRLESSLFNIRTAEHFEGFLLSICAKTDSRKEDYEAVSFAYNCKTMQSLIEKIPTGFFTEEEILSLLIAIYNYNKLESKEIKSLTQTLQTTYANTQNYLLRFLLILISDTDEQTKMLESFLNQLEDSTDEKLKSKLKFNTLLLLCENNEKSFDIERIFKEATEKIETNVLFKIFTQAIQFNTFFGEFLNSEVTDSYIKEQIGIMSTKKLSITTLNKLAKLTSETNYLEFINAYINFKTNEPLSTIRKIIIKSIQIYNDNFEYVDLFAKTYGKFLNKKYSDITIICKKLNVLLVDIFEIASDKIKPLVLELILDITTTRNGYESPKPNAIAAILENVILEGETDDTYIIKCLELYIDSVQCFDAVFNLELILDTLKRLNYNYKLGNNKLFIAFLGKYKQQLDYSKLFYVHYFGALSKTTKDIETLFTYFPDNVNICGNTILDTILEHKLSYDTVAAIEKQLQGNVSELYHNGALARLNHYQAINQKFYLSKQFKNYIAKKHEILEKESVSFRQWVNASLKVNLISFKNLNEFIETKIIKTESDLLKSYEKYINALMITDLTELSEHLNIIKELHLFEDVTLNEIIVKKLSNITKEPQLPNNMKIISFMNTLSTSILHAKNTSRFYNSIYNNYDMFIKNKAGIERVLNWLSDIDVNKNVSLFLPNVEDIIDILNFEENTSIKSRINEYLLIRELHPNVPSKDILMLLRYNLYPKLTSENRSDLSSATRSTSFKNLILLLNFSNKSGLDSEFIITNAQSCLKLIEEQQYHFIPTVESSGLENFMSFATARYKLDSPFKLSEIANILNCPKIKIYNSKMTTIYEFALKYSENINSFIQKHFNFTNTIFDEITQQFIFELVTLRLQYPSTNMDKLMTLLLDIKIIPQYIYCDTLKNKTPLLPKLLFLSQTEYLDNVLIQDFNAFEILQILELDIDLSKAIEIYNEVIRNYSNYFAQISNIKKIALNTALKFIKYIEDIQVFHIQELVELLHTLELEKISSGLLKKQLKFVEFKKLIHIAKYRRSISEITLDNLLFLFEKIQNADTQRILSLALELEDPHIKPNEIKKDSILFNILEKVCNLPFSSSTKNMSLKNINNAIEDILFDLLSTYSKLNKTQKINLEKIINQCSYLSELVIIVKKENAFLFSKEHSLAELKAYTNTENKDDEPAVARSLSKSVNELAHCLGQLHLNTLNPEPQE